MKRRAILIIAAALVAMCVMGAQALEVKPHIIGYVQSIRGDVYALNDTFKVKSYQDRKEARLLGEQDPIFEQDTVLTGPGAKCQIVFEDGMYLVIGPESVMNVAEYTWDFDNNQANNLNMRLGPGIFRYLTGRIVEKNPDATTIDSPISFLGIRGTEVLSVEMTDANPVGAIVQQLNSLGRPEDWESSSIPFKNAVNDFVRGLDLAHIMTQLTHSELHAHLTGKEMTPILYNHRATGMVTQIPRGFELFSGMSGMGQPQPITEQTRQWSYIVAMDNFAPLPTPYQGTLGTPAGGEDPRGQESSISHSDEYGGQP